MSEDICRCNKYCIQSVWQTLLYRTVEIEWRDATGDEWRRFRVVAVDSEWIELQGLDQTEPYTGGPIVTRLSNIEMVEVIE